MYLNVCVCNDFFALLEIAKTEILDFSGPPYSTNLDILVYYMDISCLLLVLDM